MKKKTLALVAVAAVLAACASTSSRDLPTQTGVDLKQYAGRWYEQARLPQRFQRDCTTDVTADYTLLPDGGIRVINQCRTKDGGEKMAEGLGRLARGVEPPDPARLEVRFAPAWTAWLPAVWGDYWIIRLEGDYEYSLVGTPDRESLWVLSRDEKADQAVVDRLLEYARSLGFPVEQMIRSAG